MNVGRSKATPFKQVHLSDFFDTALKKTQHVFKKYRDKRRIDQTYYLFDVTAGDAKYEKTSPIVFLEGLNIFSTLHFNATFIDCKKTNFNELNKNINNYIQKEIKNRNEKQQFKQNIKIIHGESQHILKTLSKTPNEWKFGLAYYDGDGFIQELWDLMVSFSKNWKHLDLMMNFSPIQLKRNSGVKKISGFKKYNKALPQLIEQIQKKDIYVRDGISRNLIGKNTFRHIMLFCTNFGDYEDASQEDGFFPLNSKEAQKIINRY